MSRTFVGMLSVPQHMPPFSAAQFAALLALLDRLSWPEGVARPPEIVEVECEPICVLAVGGETMGKGICRCCATFSLLYNWLSKHDMPPEVIRHRMLDLYTEAVTLASTVALSSDKRGTAAPS